MCSMEGIVVYIYTYTYIHIVEVQYTRQKKEDGERRWVVENVILICMWKKEGMSSPPLLHVCPEKKIGDRRQTGVERITCVSREEEGI